ASLRVRPQTVSLPESRAGDAGPPRHRICRPRISGRCAAAQGGNPRGGSHVPRPGGDDGCAAVRCDRGDPPLQEGGNPGRDDHGVAMEITGTDVAKESADMVLTDDNFASIVAAVEEGRGIYENIRKFVAFLLSANAGEVLIMFIATLAIVDPSFLPFFAPVQL